MTLDMKIPEDETKAADGQEQSCKLEENNVSDTTGVVMSSLNKLSDSSDESSKNHNGVSNHNQDSNDSACQSDYDDSASDENAKILSKLDNLKSTNLNTDSSSSKPKESEKEPEVIVIQENLFNVKIAAPGVEPFDVQVSPQEMVQELHQLLMDREDTCHRTCFSLQFNDSTLDNFSELKTVEEIKEGSEIKVIEETYSVREARLHVRHVRELLHSIDCVDAYNGSDGNSLSYINSVVEEDLTTTDQALLQSGNSTPDSPNSDTNKSMSYNNESTNLSKRKKHARALEQLLASVDCTPPEHVMPGFKDRLLTPMHILPKETKKTTCIKVLTMSMWNPPPGNRKLHGDLLYLYAVTIEQKHFHITASAKGFYVNQSDMEVFNPKRAPGAQTHHSLIDLLSQLSTTFKKNFAALNKRRFSKHPFERIGTPFQVYSWTAPAVEHTVDHVRAEDLFSSRLLVEEHIPGQQTRDWNEEIAATKELPRNKLPERLLRERAMFKVHSDFVAAASRGAMMVIDGNVMAINPGDPPNMRMYIWNNIFFSLGFDVRDHYKDFGGNHAAFYAPSADIYGVKAYNMLDIPDLHTLGTVVVDYRGYRVTAQSIIPGILEREQEQSVVYGSIDFGKTAQSHDKYKELLEKTCKQLHICPHKIKSDDGKSVQLFSSLECKGIIGNDQRHYILDLLKTYPPDVNYLPIEGEDLPQECTQLGFPKKHRHKLALLRPELIEAFVDSLYMVFMRHCAAQIVSLRNSALKEDKEKLESEENKESKCDVQTNESERMSKWQQEAVKNASRTVGSYSDSEFDIRFNPDIFSPDVKHDTTEDEIKNQKQMIKNAAKYLITHQIPTLIKDCLENTGMPGDGASLTDSLHERGIGVRYLGKILNLIAETKSLFHVHKIGVMEIIVRSTKHVARTYLQQVDQTSLSSAISHFLNCFLSSCSTPNPTLSEDESFGNKKGKKKGKKNRQVIVNGSSSQWYNLSPSSLWAQIQTEAMEYYDYELKVNGVEDVLEKFEIQRISLLRRFCIVMGIQLLMRNYSFESKQKPTFTEDDVTNVHPVVKHTSPRASDAYQFYTSGQSKVQQGYLKEGLELLGEALNLFNNVYGAIHWEISACYRHIARLNYMMGDHAEAIANQQKAVIVSERVFGIDHFTTITDYVSLALYCFAQYKINSSLKLLFRARYLFLVSYGSDHPEIALLDSNIGLVLHGVQEYDLSLKFLDEALKINLKYHGEKSLKAAISHHLVARAYSCKGEFRQALQHEKETYKLYKAQLGTEHDKTKESGECLRHLTQQAVTLQKTMNEIYKNGSTASIPPLQITPPSMNSVLDLMNVINGIIFIPLSPKDLEAIRNEVQRQQSDNEKKVAAMASKSTNHNPAPVLNDMKEIETDLD